MTDTLLVYASRSLPAESAGVALIIHVDGIYLSGMAVITVTGTGDQLFSFTGDFGPGPHTVSVDFEQQTRTQILSVDAVVFDGQAYAGEYGANNGSNGSGFFGSGPDSDPVAAEMYTGSFNSTFQIIGDLTFTGLIGSVTAGQFIFGTPASDTLVGGAGNDIIRGQAGNDTISGGDGNDIIYGGAGNDELFGGDGRDTFLEPRGSGNDTVHFQVGAGGDIINLSGYGYTGFDDVLTHMTALTGGGTLLTHPNGETTLFLNDGPESIRDVTPANFIADNFRFNLTDAPPIYGPRDTLVLHVRGDYFNNINPAEFTLDVDGHQVVGPTFVSTSIPAHFRDFTYIDDFGPGPHTVAVHFVNDAYNPATGADGNLYVGGITFDGISYAGETAQNDAMGGQPDVDPNSAEMYVNGTVTFQNVGSPSPPPAPTDSLVLHVSEYAWSGDAQFTTFVDGIQVGGTQTATASHDLGQTQDITLTGDFGTGPHAVAINFINDAWGGTVDTDRNLYVEGITFNGTDYAGEAAQNTAMGGQPDSDPNAAEMYVNGSVTFTNVAGTTLPPTSTVTLHLSEDAWTGDAQFVVAIDGVQQGGIQTVTASHGAGQIQDITLTGNFGFLGPSTVDLTFLNDVWGGSTTMDRNLYVESLDVNGVHFQGNTATNNAANGAEAIDPTAAVMAVNGLATFHIDHTAPPELMG